MDDHPGRTGGGLGTSLLGMNNPIDYLVKRYPEQIMLRYLPTPSMRLRLQHYGPSAVSSKWHSDRLGINPVLVIYKGIVISAIGPTYWSHLRTCERYILNQSPQLQLLSRPKHMSKTGIMPKGSFGTLALQADLLKQWRSAEMPQGIPGDWPKELAF